MSADWAWDFPAFDIQKGGWQNRGQIGPRVLLRLEIINAHTWKRAAILALATCSISVLPGCKTDVDKADETVSNELATAPNVTPEKAIQSLSSVAAKGSPLTKVQANLAFRGRGAGGERKAPGRVGE